MTLQHLTPEEIERFANARLGPAPGGSRVEHLSQCSRCREEVDVVHALAAHLVSVSPVAPSADFTRSVLGRIDFPELRLDHELTSLRQVSPRPGFATHVMQRVRLPVPWPERVQRLLRRRRAAFATASVATVTIMSAGAVWLFGTQGIAPSQVVAFVLGGARELAVEALLAAGRAGYQAGFIDAGGSITNAVSPVTALTGLCLVGTLGLASLWVMTRLARTRPQPIRFAKAA